MKAAALLVFLAACGPARPLELAPDAAFDYLNPWETAPRSLRQLRGKVVVLEFWATWCPSCVKEITHLNGLMDKFPGQPVQFISISSEPRATVRSFLEAHPFKSAVALDPDRKVFDAFRVRGIPAAFVIDAYGRITLKIDPAFLYDSDIRKALRMHPPLNLPPVEKSGIIHSR